MKILFIGALALLLAACGNDREPVVMSDAGSHIVAANIAEEACYQGVVYVSFNGRHSNASWGGAKFHPDGKIATCKEATWQLQSK